jgi:F-type H+-transporting ATPase subunit b
MNLFSLAPMAAGGVAAAQEAEGGGLAINFFWILVASANFLVFAVILYLAYGKQVSGMLAARRERIEQGLRDAEQAKRDRENAEQERLAAITEARREANDILSRAQKVAQETRDADIAATRQELERMRVRASDEIEAEKGRALAELRSEVAELALQAAGRVVRETMTDQRQRRLVEEFLAEPTPGSRSAAKPGSKSGASGGGG